MTKLLYSATLAIAAAVAFPGTASAGLHFPLSITPSLDFGGVNQLSPPVKVQDVGKEVAPGLFQVDPRALKGKRLVVANADGTATTAIAVCIGAVSKLGNCIGVFIDTKSQ